MKAFLLTAALLTSPALAATPIEGSWTNPSHSVIVRIGPCGFGLCGRVTGASPKARADAAAGGTPNLIGAELMSGLEQNGVGSWRGSIFVPDANRRADADLHLLDARTLEIEGCALGGLLCKSQTWTRVSPPQRSRRH